MSFPDPNTSPSANTNLTPAAKRALEEAAIRRANKAAEPAPERDGPSGKEPTRFGDWERKGIAYDF
jgi:hypothetical protein